MTLNSRTAWRLEGIHPDKTEPFNAFINFYSTADKAATAMVEIERQGFEHCKIWPPTAIAQLG